MHLIPPRQRRRHPARWLALLLACLLAAVSLVEVVHAAEPGGHGAGEACAFCAGPLGDAAALTPAPKVLNSCQRPVAAMSPARQIVAVRSGRWHGVRAPPA